MHFFLNILTSYILHDHAMNGEIGHSPYPLLPRLATCIASPVGFWSSPGPCAPPPILSGTASHVVAMFLASSSYFGVRSPSPSRSTRYICPCNFGCASVSGFVIHFRFNLFSRFALRSAYRDVPFVRVHYVYLSIRINP